MKAQEVAGRNVRSLRSLHISGSEGLRYECTRICLRESACKGEMQVTRQAVNL